MMSEWIPVGERLPEDGERVLGYDGVRVFEAEVLEGQVSNKAYGWIVTHWMPLPEPPEVTTPFTAPELTPDAVAALREEWGKLHKGPRPDVEIVPVRPKEETP